MNFQIKGLIHKSLHQIVQAAVLVPDVVDLQGDWMTKEDIQQAAWDFLAQYNKTTSLGLQHGTTPPLLFEVVESFIVPDGNTIVLGDKVYPEGTWILSVRILDSQIWASIQSGKITGFSVGGVGVRLEAAGNEEEAANSTEGQGGQLG